MEKPAQWVTKMCRLYFADIYARKTEGCPKAYPAPGVESTLQEVQQFLPDLEAKMIEFLAEWVVTLLSPATQIVKTRAPHLAFMFVKEYWFREFYLGLKVTASLGREESYTRIIDGQARCITQEQIPKRGHRYLDGSFEVDHCTLVVQVSTARSPLATSFSTAGK